MHHVAEASCSPSAVCSAPARRIDARRPLSIPTLLTAVLAALAGLVGWHRGWWSAKAPAAAATGPSNGVELQPAQLVPAQPSPANEVSLLAPDPGAGAAATALPLSYVSIAGGTDLTRSSTPGGPATSRR